LVLPPGWAITYLSVAADDHVLGRGSSAVTEPEPETPAGPTAVASPPAPDLAPTAASVRTKLRAVDKKAAVAATAAEAASVAAYGVSLADAPAAKSSTADASVQAATVAATQTALTPPAPPAPPAAAPATDGVPVLDLDVLRAAAQKLHKAKGARALRELLDQAGADSLSDIRPEIRSAFLNEIEKSMVFA
jgi:hypothetical protein